MRKLIWALSALLLFSGCHPDMYVSSEMVSMNGVQPLGKEKSLDATIDFDIGSLELSGEKNASLLYSFDLEYDKASYQPEVNYDTLLAGEEGRFSFSLQSIHRTGFRKKRHDNRLRLTFGDSIPLKLGINAGVGSARLSLSGLELSRLDLMSGVGETKISIYEPNPIPCEHVRIKSGVGSLKAVGLGNLNFGELEFEGGVGDAELDFTGEWEQDAGIRVQVGVGGVSVRMPRDLGVRIEAQKHFLSGLHLDGFSQRDSYYYSDNYDRSEIRIFIRVVTGVGGFKITRI